MTVEWGKTAVVIGAGIAGLSAATVLRRHFDRVVILERDALPHGVEQRPSVPQGRHVHTLLAGGLRALELLLPGLTDDLIAAGAVRLDMDLDVRVERVPFDPFPARDCSFVSYALSRPLLESHIRTRVRAFPGVTIEDRCTVLQILPDAASQAARGVRFTRQDGPLVELACELVADCSARGELTLALLRELGLPEPEENTIGIDIVYSSAIFQKPRDADPSWKSVVTIGQAPLTSASGALGPLEGERWLVSLAGRHHEHPGGGDDFMPFVTKLRTPTIARALEGARCISEPVRFGLRASRRRRFDRLANTPSRLVTLGDAVCRFNPVYGQGMSVAAQQCVALGALLDAPIQNGDSWAALSRAMSAEANAILDGAWYMSAVPDFVYRQTIGKRPKDLMFRLKRTAALHRLAAEDPEVHRRVLRVAHLLERPEVLYTPELNAQVEASLG